MKNSSWIDISQPLTNSMGHWPQDTPFTYQLTYTKEQTGSVNIGRITTSLHTGTHADAPFHFDNEGECIHEIDINVYIGEARVIDVSQYRSIGKKELEEIDVRGVQRLLLRTTASTNPEVFPDEITFLRKDLGPFLKEKNIFLVGVDVPSVDPLTSKTVEAHHSLYRNGVHILENLVLSDIEPGNYELIALPLPIQQADGSPVRAVLRPLQKSNR